MMHFVCLASVVLSLAPALVSSRGTLGFALGSKKVDGSCKYTADYEADFDSIAQLSGSRIVRGYSADDCNFAQQILPAAQKKRFKVVLGIWPDVPESFNKDSNAVKLHGTKYPEQVYAVTVGSETLYRKNFTGPELLSKIQAVKKIVPNIKVGTADSWNKYADGTADAVIQGGVDILFVNAFAYWQGQDINNATATYFDDIMQAYGRIQAISGSRDKIELWTGETGWPSDGGSDFENAKAGTENAKTFYQKAIGAMLSWNFNVFYFEAFDEPWKPKSIGENGKAADETHWGVMKADRSPKFSLKL